MVRRSVLDRVSPLPPDAGWEDWYLGTRIAAIAQIDHHDFPLARYRKHENNMNLGASDEKWINLLRNLVTGKNILGSFGLLSEEQKK